MKKLLAILLAAAMLFTLCACGADDDVDDRDDDEIEDDTDDKMVFHPNDDETEDEPAGEDGTDAETEGDEPVEPAVTVDPEPDYEIDTAAPDTESAAPDTEPDEPVTEPENPVLGVTDGSHYENDYFGLAYDFGAEWYIFNDEGLAELIGLTTDALDDAAFEKALEESGFAYSLYASADEGLTTLSIGVENLGVLYGTVLDEEEYIKMSEDMLVEALESVGLTDVVTETVTVTIAGADHPAVKVHGLIYDIDLYETIAVVKNGQYIACVTAASYVTDITSELLAGFYAP